MNNDNPKTRLLANAIAHEGLGGSTIFLVLAVDQDGHLRVATHGSKHDRIALCAAVVNHMEELVE